MENGNTTLITLLLSFLGAIALRLANTVGDYLRVEIKKELQRKELRDWLCNARKWLKRMFTWPILVLKVFKWSLYSCGLVGFITFILLGCIVWLEWILGLKMYTHLEISTRLIICLIAAHYMRWHFTWAADTVEKSIKSQRYCQGM